MTEEDEVTALFLFCVGLDEEQNEIYEQLKNKNPEWLIQQTIVELGFEKLIERKLEKDAKKCSKR